MERHSVPGRVFKRTRSLNRNQITNREISFGIFSFCHFPGESLRDGTCPSVSLSLHFCPSVQCVCHTFTDVLVHFSVLWNIFTLFLVSDNFTHNVPFPPSSSSSPSGPLSSSCQHIFQLIFPQRTTTNGTDKNRSSSSSSWLPFSGNSDDDEEDVLSWRSLRKLSGMWMCLISGDNKHWGTRTHLSVICTLLTLCICRDGDEEMEEKLFRGWKSMKIPLDNFYCATRDTHKHEQIIWLWSDVPIEARSLHGVLLALFPVGSVRHTRRPPWRRRREELFAEFVSVDWGWA